MVSSSTGDKGNNLLCLPRNYTVVDTETTGLSPQTCCLIEVAALRVRNGQAVEEFSTLIRPPWREVRRHGEWTEGYVDDFIRELTGISDEMLEAAPLPEDGIPAALYFLGEDLLLGHNVRFDAAFLDNASRRYLGRPLSNSTVDQLRIARKLLPQLPHHRLGDVAAALGVPYQGAHRALQDCRITYRCYEKLRALALSQGTEEEFLRLFERKKPSKPRYPGVPGHPFYKRTLVLTGSLDTPQNREAVLRAGGRLGKEVTSRTDFLAVPAPGGQVLSGREGGPAILPQDAFYRLLEGTYSNENSHS